MGVDLTIIAGEIGNYPEPDTGRMWCRGDLRLDLATIAYDSAIHSITEDEFQEFAVYVYESDGNTRVEEDRYGASLMAVDPALVINALERDAQVTQFWRIHWALDTLRSMVKHYPSGRRPFKCVLF